MKMVEIFMNSFFSIRTQNYDNEKHTCRDNITEDLKGLLSEKISLKINMNIPAVTTDI